MDVINTHFQKLNVFDNTQRYPVKYCTFRTCWRHCLSVTSQSIILCKSLNGSIINCFVINEKKISVSYGGMGL